MHADNAKIAGYRISAKDEQGYEVTYEGGYKSWCPKDTFEKNNFKLNEKNEYFADNIKGIFSQDYKERFIAEYRFLKERHSRLVKMLYDWEFGKLNFVPTCPKEILETQERSMKSYMECLEERAGIENIKLD